MPTLVCFVISHKWAIHTLRRYRARQPEHLYGYTSPAVVRRSSGQQVIFMHFTHTLQGHLMNMWGWLILWSVQKGCTLQGVDVIYYCGQHMAMLGMAILQYTTIKYTEWQSIQYQTYAKFQSKYSYSQYMRHGRIPKRSNIKWPLITDELIACYKILITQSELSNPCAYLISTHGHPFLFHFTIIHIDIMIYVFS